RQHRVTHLRLSFFDIVFDSVELHSRAIAIPDREGGSGVSVPGLTNGSGVDEYLQMRITLRRSKFIELVHWSDYRPARTIRSENHRKVTMAEERNVLSRQEQIHIGFGFRKNVIVFVGNSAMYEL